MDFFKNNLRQATTNLKNVQTKAKEQKEAYLRESIEEVEADENFTHAR